LEGGGDGGLETFRLGRANAPGRSRWHDTPTSKPPASQPNSTSAGTVTAQEVTDSMSIETVDTRARTAAAVALVRQRAPETRFLPIAARSVPDHPGYFQVNRVDRTGRALPGGWTFLVDLTKRTVVRTSGDPDRLDFAAALRRGTRA
jgi:hypothetical protein